MSAFEVEVLTKDLLHVLNLISPVIEKRNVISMLSCIKIVARENSLHFSAANETLLAEYKVGADVRKEGEIAVDVQTFADVVRKLSQDKIQINLLDNQLMISTAQCEFNLNVLSTEKFVNIPRVENPISDFKIKINALVDLIKYTEFSMLANEMRHNLNGIVLHSINHGTIKKIGAAATDGHRLSCIQTQDNFECNSFNVLLPAKLATNMLQIFQNDVFSHKSVEVKIESNKIEFISDNLVITSKLVNATFPEYENLIPKNNNNIMQVNSKLLLEAINRVTTVSTEKFRAIKMHITQGSLEIFAYSETKGKAKEIVTQSEKQESLYKYEGKELTTAFNSKYLQDVLSKTKGYTLTVKFDTDISSIVCYTDSIPGATFVIMPVKI